MKFAAFSLPSKKKNTTHLLLCSKDCCCMQSPVCPAQGTSKSKRLHLQVYGTKRWISACPTHPPCFGPQCPCRYCSTAAIIFFCWGQIHTRGCSRDAKHVSVVPVRMRDAAAEQSHLFLWHLSPVACLGSPQDTAHAQQRCGAGTHRQVLSGLPGQCTVPELCFPTLLEERPCTGQPQAPPPRVKVLPAGREVSACWAYAHPSSCPALTNWAYHPPKQGRNQAAVCYKNILSALPPFLLGSEGALAILTSMANESPAEPSALVSQEGDREVN